MSANDAADRPYFPAAGLGAAMAESEFPAVGGGTGVRLDPMALGQHRPCRAVVAATGAGRGAPRVPQTGCDGEGNALTDGFTAVDTLHASPAHTGRTTLLFHRAAADVGFDAIRGAPVAPAHRPVSEDLRVAVILHRIETFSFLDPRPVVLRTGCAR